MIKSEHVVRCGPDLNADGADELIRALEERYPTHPNSGLMCKLIPLSVGAWLLLIRIGDQIEDDVVGCGRAELAVGQVLETVDMLIRRLLFRVRGADQSRPVGVGSAE